ncbi:MAG: HipA domain-containing protein [Hydrogenovibrio sp.]
MSSHLEAIQQALRYDNLSSSAIAKATGLSQPTVSRALKKLPVVKLGAGRGTVFAWVEAKEPEPLYEIDETGDVFHLGDLYRQPESRTLLVREKSHIAYDSLPFYFYDAVPSGFLGAIHLKQIVEKDQRLTTKSQDWSDLQIWHYMQHYGEDLVGNWVLGSQMAQLASMKTYPVLKRENYPGIAGAINRSPDNMGSSVAGEQPKFTLYDGSHHLIVKYSPRFSEDNPVATRHRDLMVCEHLALNTLRANGVNASETALYQDDRLYLEVKRFDRNGLYGRKGLASLKVIDAEYVGINGTWPQIAQALWRQKILTEKDVYDVEVAYAFGRYIANADMHNGNFSFFMEGLELMGVTPVYDMLPMAYMPVQGELRNPELTAPRFIDVSNEARQLALSLAAVFWEQVLSDDLVSSAFKNLVRPFVASVLALKEREG